jgi:molybdate transport system substrate-binding protein
VSILSNILVIIGTSDLEKADRIAIGDPATVPAGTYAREYLQKIGAWDRLQTKLIPLENVRAVLAAVESGNADAGFVYRTDAMVGHARVAREITNGPAISYPFAVTTHAESREAALRFLNYLKSKPAAAVFRRHGFIVR